MNAKVNWPGNAERSGGESHGSIGKPPPLHAIRCGNCEKCDSPRRKLSDFSWRLHLARRFWNQTCKRNGKRDQQMNYANARKWNLKFYRSRTTSKLSTQTVRRWIGRCERRGPNGNETKGIAKQTKKKIKQFSIVCLLGTRHNCLLCCLMHESRFIESNVTLSTWMLPTDGTHNAILAESERRCALYMSLIKLLARVGPAENRRELCRIDLLVFWRRRARSLSPCDRFRPATKTGRSSHRISNHSFILNFYFSWMSQMNPRQASTLNIELRKQLDETPV